MKIYNTLTRQKEEFEPIHPLHVGLYCCGPTVYHYAHIGNLRTYIFEDILRRALEAEGYVVKHVMNITDVGHLTSDADEGEDKMAKGAAREKMTVWQIAEKYTQAFLEDMDRLNLLPPHIKPKATDHIADMIAQIQQIEANGLTYIGQNGNLYFDTSKFADYGKMALLDKQDLKAGARIEVDENKKNPHDFVLWFVESKHGDQDMQWESPWGRGFPGWHIECSAMATKYLGTQFDIHCGGIDHIPVHHTNEIAQAEGAIGQKPWVNYWLHGEFLVIDKRKNIGPMRPENLSETLSHIPFDPITLEGEAKEFEVDDPDGDLHRMSKSGENFITLATIIQKGYDPLSYRYMCLQAHYRRELRFSWQALEASKIGLKRMREKVSQLGEEKGDLITLYLDKFNATIQDDLNAPQALAVAWELLDDKNFDKADKLSTILEFDQILGLKLNEKPSTELPPQIVQWTLERNEARQNKEWAKADEIRDKIQESGKWVVKDGPGGTEVTPN